MRKLSTLLTVFLLFTVCAWAQNTTVTGVIKDKKSGETLVSASVIVKGTTTGVQTDLDGKFSLELDLTEPKTLVVSYLGYQDFEIDVDKNNTKISVDMETVNMVGQEVVVTGSRVSETILESSATIQKMNVREVQEIASGDFYSGLSTLQGVDVTTSSLGFQVVNMRGFNTTAPVRIVQFIDGMDNQAPGLNFPVGNLVGANDLDLENVEIISGPASALYGPNAFQGVVSMRTKNPYDYPGLSVKVAGGMRDMADIQARYAQAVGKEKRFAFKISGQYKRALDWRADDTKYRPVYDDATDSIAPNLYGDIETDIDLSAIVEQAQTDPENSQEERDDFIALNNWLSLVSPNAYPGTINVKAPGYAEKDLADNETFTGKFRTSLHYRFKKGIEASIAYNFGQGTAIYQASNRYSINNIRFQQLKGEVKGRNWNIRAYSTWEDAGDSYDIVFTGINISKEGIADYVGEYLGAYFDTLRVMTDDFDDDATASEVEAAHAHAYTQAETNGWIDAGSAKFDSLRNDIINNADLETGSKFTDKSNLQHIEGQYNFDWPWLDVLVGANFRRYDPQSFGTIFSDTLVNAGDTLENGSANLNAEFVDLSVWEVGGFVQLQKKFFKDRFKVMASVRVDKHKNFAVQFSPRASLMYNYKGHVLRISGQSAFRTPTLQNQFIRLDVGPLTINGNLNGWDNLYTLESVTNFENFLDSVQTQGVWYDSVYDDAAAQLRTFSAKKIRPEQVKTIEVGYRGVAFKKLYIDANFYYNWYTDFIGEIRVVQPEGASVDDQSGVDQLLSYSESNETYTRYQIPVNAEQQVRSMGATIGLAYYINDKFSATVNYNWAKLVDDDLDDPIIPGFNTPEHKINVGIKGRKVWKGLGFAANFQWVDEFLWRSTFGDGIVPSYSFLDLQLSYEIPKWYSTLRLGASNVYNLERQEAFGAPLIGTMVYGSITFDIKKL
ncbi:MAG: TonB-dependent receptor [Flavobacteriales bacterium]|nr:TonB-dependent receptor [Flavobacteriales bacterium]MCB9192725.1 TonB-dependent receptor [Flavobacteriales bacterium]MCB9205325.1 TonB-dependent receptor [Flavobacteriales bacterium]